MPTRQKYRQEKASFGELGVDTPSNGPKRVPRGMTPVLHTPSVWNGKIMICYKLNLKYINLKNSSLMEKLNGFDR